MPDESKQVELKEERPLSQYVVLNARGTRITTTPTTLGILALPGTFFGSLDLESADMDELFLDHDPQAVGEILTVFSNMRFSTTNALAAIRDASLRNSHSMRPLLHFLGLEWMLGLRFPSRFDDFGRCESTCKERSIRECQHEHPDVLQYLVESAGKPCWSHLHQIALVDEQVELFGLGDEAFLVEHGGFIPLGEARLLDHPALESEKQRYWPHAPQSRLVLDLGEGNAVWPAGFTFNFYMPDSHIAQEEAVMTLALQLEGVSEFQEKIQFLATAYFDLRGSNPGHRHAAFAHCNYSVHLPLTPQRRGAFRMLRLSATTQDKRVGCLSLRIYGDLLQDIPKELITYQRESHMFSPEYNKYERVGKGKTPYHGSAGFYQEWI